MRPIPRRAWCRGWACWPWISPINFVSAIGTTRIPGGVVVVGRAANLIVSDSGLQTGDIIHSLNTKPIDSVETLRSAVRDLKSGAAVVLQIERDGGLQYLAFEME